MCEEFELCSEMQVSQVGTLFGCADCEVLHVPIPRKLQVPGPTETLNVQSDEFMYLDFDGKQENTSSGPTTNNLTSNSK